MIDDESFQLVEPRIDDTYPPSINKDAVAIDSVRSRAIPELHQRINQTSRNINIRPKCRCLVDEPL